MYFGRNNTLFSYQLEGKCLEKVSDEKDLGIVISNDLKVSKQCTQAYAKANKMLGVINRTTVYKTTDILLLQLYKSLVCSHLEYCISAWSPHYHKNSTSVYSHAIWNEGIIIYPAFAKAWPMVT